jgi:hypothetical protein
VNYWDRTAAAAYGAWNPGLESELPREYLPLATIFRADNVSTSAAKAHELRDYCGLPPHVHELLVRVTSSLAIPDGPTKKIWAGTLVAWLRPFSTSILRPIASS